MLGSGCVIVGTADVEPRPGEAIRVDLRAGGDQAEDEVGEVEPLTRLDVLEHRRLHCVDPDTDVVRECRLLDVVRHSSVAVALDDAEAELHLLLEQADRDRRPARAMGAQEVLEVDRRQEVAVHDEKRLVEAAYQGQRPGGSGRLVLVRVIERDPEARAVAEVRLEQGGEMADREGDAADPGDAELANEDLEDGHVAHRHQRLRQDRRVRRQASPTPSREHHGAGAVRLCQIA